jgi:hypothetical protein
MTWVRWASSSVGGWSTGLVGSSPRTSWVGSSSLEPALSGWTPGRSTVVLSPSTPGSLLGGFAGPDGALAPEPGGDPNGDAEYGDDDVAGGDE